MQAQFALNQNQLLQDIGLPTIQGQNGNFQNNQAHEEKPQETQIFDDFKNLFTLRVEDPTKYLELYEKKKNSSSKKKSTNFQYQPQNQKQIMETQEFQIQQPYKENQLINSSLHQIQQIDTAQTNPSKISNIYNQGNDQQIQYQNQEKEAEEKFNDNKNKYIEKPKQTNIYNNENAKNQQKIFDQRKSRQYTGNRQGQQQSKSPLQKLKEKKIFNKSKQNSSSNTPKLSSEIQSKQETESQKQYSQQEEKQSKDNN